MPPRYFTVDEVNQLIPQLEALLPQLREARRQLIEQERALGRVVSERVETNGFHMDRETQAGQLKGVADDTMNDFRRLVQEVTDLGAEVKDPEQGLVDFRGLREGREVLLCWRLGEPECAWWHDLDTGFGGRQPLD